MTKCEQCQYWQMVEDNKNMGQCRRHAPSPKMQTNDYFIGPGTHRAIWPYTRRVDECAEGAPGKQVKESVPPTIVPSTQSPSNQFDAAITKARGMIKK